MSDYFNPQQEPGMERRLIVAFVLTFVIILITQPLLTKYIKKPQPQTPQQQQPQPAAQAPAQPATPPPAPAMASGAQEARTESETVMENDLYRITFSNRGGDVRSWILKRYKDDTGKPLELVHKPAAEQYGYPLSLWTHDEALRKKLASALYVAGETGAQRTPAELTFEYADRDTRVRKTFRFDHSYVVKVEAVVTQAGQPVRSYITWPAGFGDQTVPASYAAARIEWEYGQNVERVALKKISGGANIPGPFQWAGVADQYFAAVFLPDDPASAILLTLRNSIEVSSDPAHPEKGKNKVEVLGAGIATASGAIRGRMFVGPKDLKVLDSVHAVPVAGQESTPDLQRLVDFGKYLGFIARPLFLWLRWTHDQWVSNWGWAIVILTVIINLALFPLRLMSMKSAMKMQKVQPQIKAVQEKYKKYGMRDPRRQEMNQELAALYKREKVNPAGGCLPLLIQFPFLVAFYSMLGAAIELRQASWLWIRDLSAPDRLYILPVLIVLTTLIVQRMTPQAGMDPTQQKMMNLFMPLMLGFISWSLAAGLSVYWITGNLIAIVQQWAMNRTRLGREMREEAAKRARKRGQKPA